MRTQMLLIMPRTSPSVLVAAVPRVLIREATAEVGVPGLAKHVNN
jgi:hypothetical protein